MLINEITAIKPIKPLNPDQAMIAARKRQVEVAKMALRREREFQRQKKERERQRKAAQKPQQS